MAAEAAGIGRRGRAAAEGALACACACNGAQAKTRIAEQIARACNRDQCGWSGGEKDAVAAATAGGIVKFPGRPALAEG